MTSDTIDNDVTMSGGSGTLLAGRYRIVRQLGQGGMGSVWLAEDTQLDNKQFAIKMLPSILVSNKRAYRQLKDEALVAMKLVHPNIVQLRAFEENNGNPFLVMDYIDGETLDDYLAECGDRFSTQRRRDAECAEEGRVRSPSAPQSTYLPESEVLRILKPIAAALDYAHSRGVVHRDVKPGNVMIAKDGTSYILDFGIAREIQETMTRVTGKLSSGTLLYMSPEQLNGDAPKKEQDIYSFAAMAYECLKGEPPFSRGQIEYQILNNQPAPLVGRDDPIAPLAAGIMAGLAKKPEDRPPSCAAVLVREDFNRVYRADGAENTGTRRTAVRIHPQPTRENHATTGVGVYSPSRKQKESNRIGVGIAVGILALFASLGVGGLWLMLGRTEASDAVMTPGPDKAYADAIFSEARSNMAACKRLDSGDGFGARIAECQSSFNSAMTKYDLGHWSVAAQAFTNVSEKCRALIAADVDRNNAKMAASHLDQAIKVAEAAEAQKFAKIRFESATKMTNRGRGEFGDFKFAAAAATYERAKELFNLAAQDAIKAKREKDRSTAVKARNEAIVQREKVVRISDSEGFKERKDRLEDVYTRGEAYYADTAGQWLEAASCFKEYVEQSEALIQLDKERNDAVVKRRAAQVSFKRAETEGAKTHAKESWNAAVSTWNKASEEMKRMEFVKAAAMFSNAWSEFDACEKEAVARAALHERLSRIAIGSQVSLRTATDLAVGVVTGNANGRLSLRRPIKGSSAGSNITVTCEYPYVEITEFSVLPEPQGPTPRPPVTRTKVYLYEVRYIPYINENGVKKYVQASPVRSVPAGMSLRKETIDGHLELVVGANALPDGAMRLELVYGSYSAKTWISSSTFDNPLVEIQLNRK